jgi:hypothetical protein
VLKFSPERTVFNVVDGSVKAVFTEHGHAGSSGSQVRMVVCPEKQIKDTVILQCRCKKSAHKIPFIAILPSQPAYSLPPVFSLLLSMHDYTMLSLFCLYEN